MRACLSAVILSFLFLPLSARVLQVAQDGSGDYLTVQAGIDQAVAGDTVLVDSGTYTENIDFLGKSITVCSLRLLTGHHEDVARTILDGGGNGSVVSFVNGEGRDSRLDGFTIQHGTGTECYRYKHGGGIYIFNSSPTIANCTIQHNIADVGGGVSVTSGYNFGASYPLLSACTIRYNNAFLSGGGLYFLWASSLLFDYNQMNSIYLNYAAEGSDISKSPLSPVIDVVVDTFTVQNPTNFYLKSDDMVYYTFSCQHWVIVPVHADMYVSPAGDDENDGLTAVTPKKTLGSALLWVAADSLAPQTVHLGAGTYSYSATGETFPINLKSYVSILGAGPGQTILDLTGPQMLLMDTSDYEQSVTLGGFTIENNHSLSSTMQVNQPRGLTLCDITMSSDDFDDYGDCMLILCMYTNSEVLENTSLTLRNIVLSGNRNGELFQICGVNRVTLENCVFLHNRPNMNADMPYEFAGTIWGDYNYPGQYHATITNCLFAENQGYDEDWNNLSGCLQLTETDTDIINCTFGNNSSMYPHGGCLRISSEIASQTTIVNTVFYGNTPHSIRVGDSDYPDAINMIALQNCLLQNGIDGIFTSGISEITHVGNVIDVNPLWRGGITLPYFLQDDSPCIDTGTLSLPDSLLAILPDTDLLGNPRVYGSGIDMGCYEWNPVSCDDETASPTTLTLHGNYPNPFNPETRISYSVPKTEAVEVSVYNLRGQLVKTLFRGTGEAGEHTVRWNGTDSANRACASGVYFCKVKAGTEVKVHKMMLMK